MNVNSEIVQLGADVLRQQAVAVDDFTCPEFKQFVSVMQSVMHDRQGVGIAAPQLNISLQIMIVASRPTLRYPLAPEMAPVVMVNPRYNVLDSQMLKDWEGCLSLPGIRALVPRYRALQVFYQTPDAEWAELVLQDFPARVFQHEFDHLQGLVYLDRVESNRDIISESEFLKKLAA